jgi:serine/threonine-protein kinase
VAAKDSFAPGEVVGSRYEIKATLGRGGFGTVFRALHRDLGKDVALKVLNPELAANELARARFLKEVEATTAFVHKYAVQLREFGHDPAKNVLYFTMDLVEGETLRSVLEREKRLGEARAARLVSQVLEALEEAHAAGLVHRDLKPENLIVTRGREGEEVRVLDFGIAKAAALASESTAGLTAPGTTLGTIFYMSPEQDEGSETLDGRSDLYSVGVILYECLAGKRPIEPDPGAENPLRNFRYRLSSVAPEPLERVAPGASAACAAVVHKALEKERGARFPSARAMREALVVRGDAPPELATLTGLETGARPAASGKPSSSATLTGLETGARPAEAGKSSVPTALAGLTTGPRATALDAQAPAPTSTAWKAALGVLVLMALGGGAFVLGRREAPGPSLPGPVAPPSAPVPTPVSPPPVAPVVTASSTATENEPAPPVALAPPVSPVPPPAPSSPAPPPPPAPLVPPPEPPAPPPVAFERCFLETVREGKNRPLAEGAHLPSGGEFRIHVQLDHEAHVYVFNFDATGHAAALFPGTENIPSLEVLRAEGVKTTSLTPKGKELLIPPLQGKRDVWFTLDENDGGDKEAGRETIYVACSAEELKVDDLVKALEREGEAGRTSGHMAVLASAGAVVRAITFRHDP